MRASGPVPPRLRALALVLGGALALGLAACGSTEPGAATVAETKFADTLHLKLADFRQLASGVYVRDSVEGTGTVLAAGQGVDVTYLGYLPDGRLILENTSTTAPLTFTLGSPAVIEGWNAGLVGMKVGGKRVLVVPPELGYGDEGRGPVPPRAVLVFIIDARAARP